MARLSRLDLLYILVFIAAFALWNVNKHSRAYDELMLRSSADPRRALDRLHHAMADDDDDDGGGDEDGLPSSSEADADAEEAEEMDRDLEEMRRQAMENAKRQEEESIVLNAKLEMMRNQFKQGLRALEQRQRQPEQDRFEEEEEDDNTEAEFAEELNRLIASWTKSVDDVNRVAAGGGKSSDDENLLKLAQEHVRWERSELSKLIREVEEKTTTTLSGEPLPDFSRFQPKNTAQDLHVDDDQTDEQPEDGNLDETSAVDDDSGDDDDMESSSELFDKLRGLERALINPEKGDVIVLGEKTYIARDFAAYEWVFSKAGYTLKRKKANTESHHSTRMSQKQLASGDWSIILCLALNTDHCFTSSTFAKTSHRYQRINRLIGLRAVLWSKDSFCKTIKEATYGTEFEAYTFTCWLFPKEYHSAKAYARDHPDVNYIVKPLTMGGGVGIFIAEGEKGLYKIRGKTHVVQTYLPNPYLINGFKWDLRSYVLVTSTYPMRVYLYSRGLVRFASQEYDANAKKGGKRSMFLTNTSVNKKYVKKGNITEITWPFDKLASYCESHDISYDSLWNRIGAAVSVVFLSAEQAWKKYFDARKSSDYCPNCYQVMGVDVIVDSELNPMVIEVNGQPSMQLSKDASDHYSITKKKMISDLVGLVFNPTSVARELSHDLQSIEQQELVQGLKPSDMEYLLDYKRENANLGLWTKVYPSYNHLDLHSRFLETQSCTAQRMRLHKVLAALEAQLGADGEEASASDTDAKAKSVVN